VSLAEDGGFSRDALLEMLNGGITPGEIIELLISQSAGTMVC